MITKTRVTGNRLNGFQVGVKTLVTWLKPGAKEIKHIYDSIAIEMKSRYEKRSRRHSPSIPHSDECMSGLETLAVMIVVLPFGNRGDAEAEHFKNFAVNAL